MKNNHINRTKPISLPIPLLIVVGPTASGKSDLAVKLARLLSSRDGGENKSGRIKKIAAEIISADSRQVYKGLDIGTGKITTREMRGVPHHLLDVADPWVPANSPRHFTVEKWRRLAEAAIADIHARGRLPIVCGGTGFYISALVDGMTFPDVPPDKRLRERLAKKSTSELFGQLKKLDPRRARDMRANGDWKNGRRLIRAIEIVTSLGKVPPMTNTENKKNEKQKYDPIFIGIAVPLEELKKRIEKRLKSRLKNGMIAEVKNLHKHKPRRTRSGKRAGLSWKRMDELGLEYRFISRYLRGSKSQTLATSTKIAARKKEMTTELSSAIWHYAKRQMTWWKRDKRIVWLTPAEALRKFGRNTEK
jgi:tRNA dimethylallyltransferase